MILIDTHVWIWLHTNSSRLSRTALERIQGEDRIAISPVSIYETMVAADRGRIAAEEDAASLISQWLKAWDITSIPISQQIVILSRTLNFSHSDPFDRIIAATAFHEGIPILTADGHLLKLGWLNAVPAT